MAADSVSAIAHLLELIVAWTILTAIVTVGVSVLALYANRMIFKVWGATQQAKCKYAAREELKAGMFDLNTHLKRQIAFSSQAFGPDYRLQALLDHIRKELSEIEAEPRDLEEWIDLILLGLDGAWRSGHSPADICEGLQAKQTKNESRTWPDWRNADPSRAIEHIDS